MGEGAPGYRITVGPDRIVVEQKGAVTMDEIVTFRRDLARLTTDRHLSLVLIDLSRATSWSLTMLDIFDLCVTHPRVLTPTVAIAVVHRPDQLSVRDAEAAEVMGGNHDLGCSSTSRPRIAGCRTDPRHDQLMPTSRVGPAFPWPG
jgi:hypothetical protein